MCLLCVDNTAVVVHNISNETATSQVREFTVSDAALRSDVVKPLVWPHNFIMDVSILKQFPHNNALFNSR